MTLTPREDEGFYVNCRCPQLVGEAPPVVIPADLMVQLALQGSKLSSGHLTTNEEARSVGRGIYRALFGEAGGELLAKARGIAERENSGLRLVLEMDLAPQLHEVPWELLHDGRGFVAQDPWTPIVRYLRQASPLRSPVVSEPLRMLFTRACPYGYDPLDLATEEKWIRKALKPLGDRVKPVFRKRVSFKKLVHVLRHAQSRDRPFHVWHHSGHGLLQDDGELGLVLDAKGAGDITSAERLGKLFATSPDLRLAVLNTCFSGARLGLATELARLNVPMVVGFRGGVFDQSARLFARTFYASLGQAPVDVLVNRARHELSLRSTDVLDWIQPIIFSRTTEPRLLAPETSSGAANSSPQDVGAPVTKIRFGGKPRVKGQTTEVGTLTLNGGSEPVDQSLTEIEFASDVNTGELLRVATMDLKASDVALFSQQFNHLVKGLARRSSGARGENRTQGSDDGTRAGYETSVQETDWEES